MCLGLGFPFKVSEILGSVNKSICKTNLVSKLADWAWGALFNGWASLLINTVMPGCWHGTNSAPKKYYLLSFTSVQTMMVNMDASEDGVRKDVPRKISSANRCIETRLSNNKPVPSTSGMRMFISTSSQGFNRKPEKWYKIRSVEFQAMLIGKWHACVERVRYMFVYIYTYLTRSARGMDKRCIIYRHWQDKQWHSAATQQNLYTKPCPGAVLHFATKGYIHKTYAQHDVPALAPMVIRMPEAKQCLASVDAATMTIERIPPKAKGKK